MDLSSGMLSKDAPRRLINYGKDILNIGRRSPFASPVPWATPLMVNATGQP